MWFRFLGSIGAGIGAGIGADPGREPPLSVPSLSVKVWPLLIALPMLGSAALVIHERQSGEPAQAASVPTTLPSSVTTSSSDGVGPQTSAAVADESATNRSVATTTVRRSSVATTSVASSTTATTITRTTPTTTAATTATTTTKPTTTTSKPATTTTAAPVSFACTLSLSPTSVRAGGSLSATVQVPYNSRTNRGLAVSISVAGRGVVTSGVTNDQGYFTGTFTAQPGDSGDVTATVNYNGQPACTRTAHYTVT